MMWRRPGCLCSWRTTFGSTSEPRCAVIVALQSWFWFWAVSLYRDVRCSGATERHKPCTPVVVTLAALMHHTSLLLRSMNQANTAQQTHPEEPADILSCLPSFACMHLQKTGKQPDFRMAQKLGDGRKDALWLTDRQLPAWVKRNLELLPGGVPFPLPPFIPREALSGSPKEQQWVEVFTNLPAFWDNRLNVGVVWGPKHAV